jgi:lipoprotein-anchoring transpeptidase ErfK/SrfK
MAALRSIERLERAPAPARRRRTPLGRRGLLCLGLLAAATVTIGTASARADASAPDGTVRIERSFPAAGQLTVDAIAVRREPSLTAPLIKRMAQFRPDYRAQVIFAVAERTGTDGKPWYRISVPMRPNGTMGWIPADSVELAPTANRIVVHRRSRTIDVYSHGRRALHAIVAIGAPGMETPVGHYYVQARFVPDDSFLGVFALETSAYSKLSEWPGGGVVGIHGTSMPQLLGQAVSHGCVRVANATAAALRRLAPLGTPITISD